MQILYDIPGVGQIAKGVPFSLTTTIEGPDGPYEDEIRYPGNWLENADQEWLDEHNITIIEIPDPPIDLVAYLADKRWQVEISGTYLADKPIATDRDSQGKLLAEFVAIEAGIRIDPSPWKFADGHFEMVTNEEMLTIIIKARDHVAYSFMTEATILSDIIDGTITTPEEIDMADWPPNHMISEEE